MVAMSIFAQPARQNREPQFDPQKFQQMVEEELTRTAELTPEEAKAVLPLYTEMRQKQRELGKKVAELKKTCGSDEKANADAVNKICNLKVDMAELERSYCKKMLKVLPAGKILKLMRAEDEIHRKMVQRSRPRRGDGNGEPRQGKHRK